MKIWLLLYYAHRYFYRTRLFIMVCTRKKMNTTILNRIFFFFWNLNHLSFRKSDHQADSWKRQIMAKSYSPCSLVSWPRGGAPLFSLLLSPMIFFFPPLSDLM